MLNSYGVLSLGHLCGVRGFQLQNPPRSAHNARVDPLCDTVATRTPTLRWMYELRPATQNDYDFMYGLLVATMKEYVDQTWGWEEPYQQERFQTTFAPADYQIILVNGHDIGAISVDRRDAELFLSEIQIAPEHQRRGFGTAVIQDLIHEAERQRLPVGLQVLKVNPARRLYERLGFRVTDETDTHYQMSRPTSSVGMVAS